MAKFTCCFLGFICCFFAVGCDGRDSRLAETYTGLANPKDKIVFTSGSEAEVTAIAGQPINVWNFGGRGGSALGRELQAAREANTSLESVEVAYNIKGDMIVFTTPNRGSRTLRIEQEGIILSDSAGRKYASK